MNQQHIHLTIGNQSADQADASLPEAIAHRVSAFDLVAGTPWAIEPSMLDTIRLIALRENEGVEALEAKLGRPLQNARPVSLRDGVAVIPVTGPIFRYANLMTQLSGATSMEMLAKDFTAALEDPQVKSIVLEINSPGGQVTGVAEFAQMVNQASKPVVAYVDGMAASAAYWIAAAAQQVVMNKSAVAGNVGAVLGYDTRKDPNKAEIVSSQSPNKRPDLSTDAGRSQMQSLIDDHAQVFIEDVAAFRGMTPEAVIKDWNGGAVFIAAQAVSLGMADRVSTLEEVIAGLSGSTRKQGVTMTANASGQPTATIETSAITREYLTANHADLVAVFQTEGATAERARIQAVEAQALPGHEKLIAQLKFDGKTTGPEAAVQVLNAERNVGANRHAQLVTDAPAPVAHAAAPETAPVTEDKSQPIEDRAKAKWDADSSIRSEFSSFDNYLAYAKAVEAGSVRVLSTQRSN